jgi:hypothetical protein
VDGNQPIHALVADCAAVLLRLNSNCVFTSRSERRPSQQARRLSTADGTRPCSSSSSARHLSLLARQTSISEITRIMTVNSEEGGGDREACGRVRDLPAILWAEQKLRDFEREESTREYSNSGDSVEVLCNAASLEARDAQAPEQRKQAAHGNAIGRLAEEASSCMTLWCAEGAQKDREKEVRPAQSQSVAPLSRKRVR